MIPLILLALGLGVALSAYELSPHARSRIDDYARAILGAHAAHQAADAHLSNASAASSIAAQHADVVQRATQGPPATSPAPMSPAPMPAPTRPAPPPAPALPALAHDLLHAHANAFQAATDAGVDHVVAATTANQEAAKNTADAAKSAKTDAERAAAAQSAAKVLEREQQIAVAMVSLGVGECGVRAYDRVTARVKDQLLAKLHGDGMTVTGDNPWTIDTHQAEVKLRAVWDPKSQVLKLVVVSSAAWAPCSVIWDRIEPKLREVIGG